MTALVQLAALYFFAFASLGAYLPWLPPFLERRGFSPALIGLALALPAFCRAVFPPAWGWIADRYQARREIVVVATAVGGIALCLLGATDIVPVLLALLFLYGFVNVPVGPVAEVLTFAALGGRKERYGRIRLRGSIGFITTSVGVGYAVRSHGDAATAWGAGLPLLAAAVCASALPSARASGATVSPPERAGRLRLRLLIPIWIAAACASAAHGPYYTFFTLDLAGRGLPAHWIGLLWAWSVVAEILLMAGAPRVLGRLGLVVGLRLGLVLGILRWSLTRSVRRSRCSWPGWRCTPPRSPLFIFPRYSSSTASHLPDARCWDNLSCRRRCTGRVAAWACTLLVNSGT